MTATIKCLVCDKLITLSPSEAKKRKTCSPEHHFIWREKFKTTTEALLLAVWSEPVTEVAYQYGVSDKAIEKRCKKLGVVKPPRGYWAKIQSGRYHATSLIELGWNKEDIKNLEKIIRKAEAAAEEAEWKST